MSLEDNPTQNGHLTYSINKSETSSNHVISKQHYTRHHEHPPASTRLWNRKECGAPGPPIPLRVTGTEPAKYPVLKQKNQNKRQKPIANNTSHSDAKCSRLNPINTSRLQSRTSSTIWTKRSSSKGNFAEAAKFRIVRATSSKVCMVRTRCRYLLKLEKTWSTSSCVWPLLRKEHWKDATLWLATWMASMVFVFSKTNLDNIYKN